jgi:hypothetical protein
MAKKQQKKLDISKFSNLDWQKSDAMADREVIDNCDFCSKDIYDVDKYWEVFPPIEKRNNGEAILVACLDCGTAAGLEW